MSKIPKERRFYPRIKACLKVEPSKYVSGNSIDLSGCGLSFITQEVISNPTVSLQISFPDLQSKFKTKARLVWKRKLEDGSYLYGMEFLDLNDNQKVNLRKRLIKIQIRELLDKIREPETKRKVSRFFLNDVLNYTNEIVKVISWLPREDEYSLEIEKKIEHLNNQTVLKGHCLEELLPDKKITQEIKETFRYLIGTWVYKSAIMKRALEKPRAYPGDYRMIETVYDNKSISKNIGEYFDNYFLKNPYAVAVRIRKDRLRELLQDFIDKAKIDRMNILNIACGSCREIRELLPNLKNQGLITFTCLDWDEEALKFSKNTLLRNVVKNVRFKFVKDDIMSIIKSEVPTKKTLSKQNLIYSIGLIDYLPDRILKKLIYVLYQLLEQDSKLILTHKNREKTFPPIPPHWFCDWKFVPRDKKEVLDLFYNSGVSNSSLKVECDDFGYIYYFTATKK